MTSKKPTSKKDGKIKDELSQLFVNHNGVLCYTVKLYEIDIYTMIGVQPYLYTNERGCIKGWRYTHI